MRIDLGQQAAKWQQQQMGNLGSKDKLFFFQSSREREKQRQMESCVREARRLRCCHAFN